MITDKRDILSILKTELTFVEQGGYARQATLSWYPPLFFQDSPSCPNYNDASQPHACADCPLLQLVPEADRHFRTPCRYIPVTEAGQTIEDLYPCTTQKELEWTFTTWLRAKIREIELERMMLGSGRPTFNCDRLLAAPK